MGVDPGQLEPLVQQRELPRQLGDERVERRGVDLGRVAVGDRRDADQRLELADARDVSRGEAKAPTGVSDARPLAGAAR